MQLKNKEDGEVYKVTTEADGHSGFMIFAESGNRFARDSFCMHYQSLKEFTDEWEDVD